MKKTTKIALITSVCGLLAATASFASPTCVWNGSKILKVTIANAADSKVIVVDHYNTSNAPDYNNNYIRTGDQLSSQQAIQSAYCTKDFTFNGTVKLKLGDGKVYTLQASDLNKSGQHLGPGNISIDRQNSQYYGYSAVNLTIAPPAIKKYSIFWHNEKGRQMPAFFLIPAN